MRILFTGASSFTGTWFVRALATNGHEVVATFRRERGGYEGLSAERVSLAERYVDARYELSFGSEAFVELVRAERFDLLCHHAADVRDYRSPNFDVIRALANNTKGLATVLDAFKGAGGKGLVLTGTFFGGGEGLGELPLHAFSPYGLSKSLTTQMVAYFAHRAGVTFGSFVVPNPFGPYEEPRFTAYLVRSWLADEVPSVATPAYVRDNIHVSALALAYASFADDVAKTSGEIKRAPSGYVESQGAFAQRFAREIGSRLGLETPLELADQRTFDEPRVRLNPDRVEQLTPEWNERAAWDELAAYYRDTLGKDAG